MTDELRDKLAALRVAVPSLNKATDQATKDVAEVQRLLTEELNVGISHAVRFQHTQDVKCEEDGHGCDQTIAINVDRSVVFGRFHGSYQIYITEERWKDATNERGLSEPRLVSTESTSWGSCSREVKLLAYARLPELVAGITDRALSLAEKAVETAELVRGALGPGD